jgi:hypothetical protein
MFRLTLDGVGAQHPMLAETGKISIASFLLLLSCTME